MRTIAALCLVLVLASCADAGVLRRVAARGKSVVGGAIRGGSCSGGACR